MLIDAGADINKVNNDGYTPLSLAMLEGLNDIVKMLIDAGTDINVTFQGGGTPQLCAANRRHSDFVKMLIDACADINMANKYGHTPLLLIILLSSVCRPLAPWIFFKNGFTTSKSQIAD